TSAPSMLTVNRRPFTSQATGVAAAVDHTADSTSRGCGGRNRRSGPVISSRPSLLGTPIRQACQCRPARTVRVRTVGTMTSVVIVGSGFAGFECARHLSDKLRRQQAPVDITMISPVDYMLYTPLLPDVAGGVVDARFVTVPLANTLRGVRTARGWVDSVDFDARTVSFTDPEDRTHTVAWDRLVLTPGSVTRLFDIPCLAEHARGLKSTAEALYLRDHFLQQLQLSCIDDDPDEIAARRTVVVV